MADTQPDAEERTEEATQKRLEDSRQKGQVARSKELTTTALMLASASGILLLGPTMFDDIATIMTANFKIDAVVLTTPDAMWLRLSAALSDGLEALGMFFALVVVAALMAPMALGGWSASGEQLAPKLEKLDPIKGLAKLFSLNGLLELLKSLAKFLLLTGAALLMLWLERDEVISLAGLTLRSGVGQGMQLIGTSFLVLAAVTIIISLIDVPYQLWNHARQLRMTHQEVKDEMKQTEGKPEIKNKIRSLQREIATRRMMESVPDAYVIVVNPSHYAVAIRYVAESMSAPVLLAKGADLVALRIRDIGKEHNIPIVSAPPLARAIYAHTRLNQEIPAGLYLAVAQVLAYVFQLRKTVSLGPRPQPPSDLPIPTEFLNVDLDSTPTDMET